MSRRIRAKFQCHKVEHVTGGYRTATLGAVYSQTGENADFAKATPSGQLVISISPETPAVDFFEPGKDYYLEFEAVAAPAAQ